MSPTSQPPSLQVAAVGDTKRKQFVVASGISFLAIQKIIKKSTSQKINFFGIFWHFQRFFDRFFTILGLFWGPREVIFRFFWQVNFSVVFFSIFLKKKQKLKKRRSSFHIVKYSVSWGSPCWKNCEEGLKKTSFFSSIFHPKSTENQSKNRGKRHSQQKSMKKRFLGRLFWEKVDFCWFLGSQGVPKNC